MANSNLEAGITWRFCLIGPAISEVPRPAKARFARGPLSCQWGVAGSTVVPAAALYTLGEMAHCAQRVEGAYGDLRASPRP